MESCLSQKGQETLNVAIDISPCSRAEPTDGSHGVSYIFTIFSYHHGAVPFTSPLEVPQTVYSFCLGQISVALFFSYQSQKSVSQERELPGLSGWSGLRAWLFFLFRLILPV